MRLLSLAADDAVAWEEFSPHAIPPYAILSHTWGTEEVTFSDLVGGLGKEKAGWQKIVFCGEQAARDGLHYFWVDTCCSDKWNKREREKAVNSMFSWYRDAARCYVYLVDVSAASAEDVGQRSLWETSFRASKWFKRGWTLQELIAPLSVQFFSKEEQVLGSKSTLEHLIHEITNLPIAALRCCSLDDFSTSERMLWATGRDTTEPEDGAYCLLGIVGAQLPLTYGEGKEKAIDRLREVLEATSAPCILPYSQNKRFVGRQLELAALEAALFSSKHATRIVITGEGGTGKSQLALELAYRTRHARKNCSVFWIDASNVDSLSQSYAHIARRLDVAGWDDEQADVQKLVHAYLDEQKAGEWLLVFDNMDDINAEAAGGSSFIKSLPLSELGSMVSTTIESGIAKRLAPDRTIELGGISPDSGQEMMQGYLSCPVLLPEQEHVQLLLGELCFLPLAIVHAAAFINTKDITIKEYRMLLQDKRRVLTLPDQVSNGILDASLDDPVAATWRLSFEQLRRAHAAAADCLCFMGCISGKDVPLDVLVTPSNDRKEDAICILSAYALVTRRPGDSAVDLHRLVHHAMQEWLREWQLLDYWTQKAIARLDQVFPSDDHRNRHQWRRLLPHAQTVLSHVLDESHLDGDAEVQKQSPQAYLAETGPKSDEAVINLMRKCGIVLYYDGRWAEAEQLEVQVMETSKMKLGADHPDTLTSMANLASTYRNQGRWEEAEQLEVQVIETRKTKLGADHPDTLTSMANLASTYRNQGRWEEAEQLEVQVMEMSKTKLGADHPDTLTSMNNLAYTWKNQGRDGAAIQLMTECVSLRKSKLGDNHPGTISSRQTLSSWSSSNAGTAKAI